MVEQTYQDPWDYYDYAIYKIEITDAYLYSTGPRFTGTSGGASGGARTEFVPADIRTFPRPTLYLSRLRDVEFRSRPDPIWTEQDYENYRNYGVFGLCPDGSQNTGGSGCSEPDGTYPTGDYNEQWLHRIRFGSVMQPPTDANGGASNTNASLWRLGEYYGTTSGAITLGQSRNATRAGSWYRVTIVAWYEWGGSPPPYLGPWDGGPPDGPSCPPCEDRECLAPENRPDIDQILLLIDGLEAPQPRTVDLTSIDNALDSLITHMDELIELHQTHYRQTFDGFAALRQSLIVSLKLMGNDVQALNQTLVTLITQFVKGSAFDALLDFLVKTFELLSDNESVSMEYTTSCDQSAPSNIRIQGQRLEVIQSAPSAVATVACEVAAKNDEFQSLATWPEWWATRPGSQIEQCITVYAPKDDEGNWLPGRFPIAVPHSNRPSPVEFYWRGTIKGRLVLADNSDLIVHCRSNGDAHALIVKLKSRISSSYLRGSSESYGRRSDDFQVVKVWRFASAYYPQGQLSREPQWIENYA